jgi:2-polyprenyl-6-hydroxyphenyl methylase/3-demethylubiquinone-9 3-methyltransferase
MSPKALAKNLKSKFSASQTTTTQVAARTLPARQLAGLLVDPPAQSLVYRSFNRVRQAYILQQVMKHFHIREDDPAPLYGRTLLDAGCGTSTIAEFLALSGAEITAIDPDATAIKQAQQSAEAFGAPITFMAARAEDLLPKAQRYHVILALDLLEDTPNDAKMLFTLHQLLVPGGLLIVSAINRTAKAWFLHIFLSVFIYGRSTRTLHSWRHFYAPATLQGLAAAQGFRLLGQQFLRFSSSRRRWKTTTTPDTRYLQTYTTG